MRSDTPRPSHARRGCRSPASRSSRTTSSGHCRPCVQTKWATRGKQTTVTPKSLQKVIAVHKLEEIKAIFELVKNKHTKRRLPLDTVKMAGTNPAVRIFKKLTMANISASWR